jgi:N4-gp56 family major capsid protein
MGTSPNAAIQVSNELGKNEGDAITFGYVDALDKTTAITGDNTAEGNESQLGKSFQRVTIDQVRKAIRLNGKMTEQRSAINLINAAKAQLKEWDAQRLDYELFAALSATPSTNRVKYGADATSEATITTDDILSCGLIRIVKAMAMTGNAGASRKIRPLKVRNKNGDVLPFYGMVVDPHVARRLKETTEFKSMTYYVYPRGFEDNPVLDGSIGYIDGVMIYVHDGVVTANTGTGSVRIARNIFFGAQAGFAAWGQKTKIETKTFDYGNQEGFCISQIRGVARASFTDRITAAAEDNGTILVKTYAVV